MCTHTFVSMTSNFCSRACVLTILLTSVSLHDLTATHYPDLSPERAIPLASSPRISLGQQRVNAVCYPSGRGSPRARNRTERYPEFLICSSRLLKPKGLMGYIRIGIVRILLTAQFPGAPRVKLKEPGFACVARSSGETTIRVTAAMC